MNTYLPGVYKMTEKLIEGHLIASHVIPTHNRDKDFDFSQRLGGINKLVGGRVDVMQVSRMYNGSPILLRDHPISEQKDDAIRDPVGTGKRHAQEMMKYFYEMEAEAKRRKIAFPTKDKIIFPGINEWVLDAGDRRHMDYQVWLAQYKKNCELLDKYTVAFLDELTKDGFKGAAFNLSVGWPSNLVDDAPPHWDFFEATHQAILRGNHYLCLHEYWSDKGPDYMWGWWAGRFTQCPWNVPIIIGECGIDMYVINGIDDKQSRGFALNVTHEVYVDQLFRYEQLCWEDPRIVAIQIFTSDGKTQDWGSFDIAVLYDAIYDRIAKLGKRKRKQMPKNTKQPKPSTPKPNPGPTQGDFKPFRARVRATVLNVRSGPGIEFSVVNMLANGAVVDVTELHLGGWSKIGENQWVSSQWIETYQTEAQVVDSMLENFARIYHLDVNVVKATFAIESGGQAFGINGKPVIRFENHIFFKELNNPDLYYKYFWHDNTPNSHTWRRDESSQPVQFHGNQKLEWEVFEFAKSLDETAATRSISMGMAQIMGFNHLKVGYISPTHMLNAFSEQNLSGYIAQVFAFFAYCINTPGAIDYLRNKDFLNFALVYNGAASYAPLLENQYNLLSKASK